MINPAQRGSGKNTEHGVNRSKHTDLATYTIIVLYNYVYTYVPSTKRDSRAPYTPFKRITA